MSTSAPSTYCSQCGHEMTHEELAGRHRPVCPSCGFVAYQNPVPGVAILCEMDDGLLLIKRGHEPHKGRWTLPSGYIEADESAEQAAVRECLEETGLDIKLSELFGVSSFPKGSLNSGIIIFYRAQPIGGQLQAGDDASDARVFPLEAIPPIPFSTHRDVVDRWIRRQSRLSVETRPDPTIREAHIEDEEHIITLLQSIPANATLSSTSLELARQRLREKLGLTVLVAEVGNSVVGYLVLSLIPALSGLRAWIDDVVVDPDYQRRGLGAALVEAAIQQASLRGATHLFVYTSRGDSGVREFYSACGFDELGVAPLRIR